MQPESLETTPAGVSLGARLSKAREARGWTLLDVSKQLNLTRQHLTYLESGEFEKLPGRTFARGYLRAYGKLLGLNPEQLLIQFDQLVADEPTLVVMQSLGRLDAPKRVSSRTLQLFSVLVVCLLLVGGFYLWNDYTQQPISSVEAPEHIEVQGADGTLTVYSAVIEPEDAAVTDAQNAPVPQESGDVTEQSAVDNELGVLETLEQVEQAESVVQLSAASVGTTVPVPPVLAAPTLVAPSVAAPSETAVEPVAAVVAAAVGEGALEVAFSETCWIEVVDASGKVLHRGLKRKGENLQLIGKSPLKVHLGLARAAHLRFNGLPVDLTDNIRGETARVILGQ